MSVDQAILTAKYDEARDWISQVSNINLRGSSLASLKNGVVLCQLINAIAPGAIPKINDYDSRFRHIENLQFFNTACIHFGVPTSDLFDPDDFYDEVNISQVVVTLHSLSRVLAEAGFEYPTISDEYMDDIRRHASSASATRIRKRDSGLSAFEESQKKAQALASASQPYRASNLIRTTSGSGAQNVFSYADQSIMQAQKIASGATGAGRSIIKTTDRPTGALSFAEQRQLEAQRLASMGHTAGHNVVRTAEGAGSGSVLSMAEQRQLEAQKLSSEAKIAGHNVVRTDKGAGSGSVLSIAEQRQLEAQKLASEAKIAGHNIVHEPVY